jgi:hypothetical protein
MMVDRIHERFPDAIWRCVHRDPIGQFESIIRTYIGIVGKNSPLNHPGGKLNAVLRYWLSNEYALERLQRLGVEVTHWHMDFYTKPEGLAALIDSLGLKRLNPVKMLPKIHAANCRYEADAALRKHALKLFNSLPNLTAAYKAARRA